MASVSIQFKNTNIHYPYADILKFLWNDGVGVHSSSEDPGWIKITFKSRLDLDNAVHHSCVIPLGYEEIEKVINELPKTHTRISHCGCDYYNNMGC